MRPMTVVVLSLALAACGLGAPSTGDGGTGGGSGTGGSVGTGGSAGTGGSVGTGGSSGVSLDLIPTSATVGRGEELLLAAHVVGAVNQTVSFSFESGLGALASTGINTARYTAPWTDGTASIRVTAAADASATRVVPITVTGNSRGFYILPEGTSGDPLLVSAGSRQSFALVTYVSPGGLVGSAANLTWRLWPEGSITNGAAALPTTQGPAMVFANDPTSNTWSALALDVGTTSLPSVEVVPSLATVQRGGVVQLTANVSIGGPVTWTVLSQGRGTVSATGLYTAPTTPGVYVVEARAMGTVRTGLATIVVQ